MISRRRRLVVNSAGSNFLIACTSIFLQFGLAPRRRDAQWGIACDKYYEDVTNILKIATQSHNILRTTRIARLGRAAVSDGIERECGEPLAVKQTASSFCEICRAPRCANGDVKSFFGGLGAVRTRLVFPDPMEGFPDERI
jgi:hypothetical protein